MVIETLLVLYGIGLGPLLAEWFSLVWCYYIGLGNFSNQIALHQKVINCIEDESELRDIKWIMVEIQFIHQDKCRYS